MKKGSDVVSLAEHPIITISKNVNCPDSSFLL